MELLIKNGPDAMAEVFRRLLNFAMRIEREQFLGAGEYERGMLRRGYGNGFKSKSIDTPAGTIALDVPKTRQHDGEPFFPQALERGTRSNRAVMACIAEMYVKGVSTRDVQNVMAELGLKNVSSTQVSRANALLDEELAAWRERPLGEVRYLVVDARYEKVRQAGVVVDTAVLTAVGILPDGRRHVLGTSVALSEAEVHWRAFLESLVDRGMKGVRLIVSDDHSGLKAARKAVLPGVRQFHLAQNAIHHAPTVAIRQRIGAELRTVWNATKLPEAHRRKIRTTNGIERPIQQELKRRTRKVRIFPNTDALLRLASAILVEIDEKWTTEEKRYVVWEPETSA